MRPEEEGPSLGTRGTTTVSHPPYPCVSGLWEGRQKDGHSLEKAQNEGVEAAPAAGQWGQTADLVIQGAKGPGAGAWGHGCCQPGPSAAPVAVPAMSHSLPSPGFTDASTTLQGLLLRCPVMRSFLKGFSPSATRA